MDIDVMQRQLAELMAFKARFELMLLDAEKSFNEQVNFLDVPEGHVEEGEEDEVADVPKKTRVR